MAAGYEDTGGFLMIHEYLNDGFAWMRASVSNSSKYFDRYTSVGWSKGARGGANYPGQP